jgi:hypothetical protein
MKVFISHAHEDQSLVRRIAQGLQKNGLDVWLDETEIMPGENWAQRISEALEESQAMVVVITPNTLRSPWVHREIEYALGKKSYRRRVVPVIVGPEDDIPADAIPWILRRLKMVMMPAAEREDEGIREIAAVLRAAS